MISGKEISLQYKSKSKTSLALNEASFSLRKGRITTFMGPSGAGKTTLLKCVAGLQNDYDGVVTLDGTDMKTLGQKDRALTVGFVLQHFHLFPHFTVLKNCTYAQVHVAKLEESEAEKRAVEILESLHMESFMRAYPSQLSGGQQQRVAIARALVLRPKILLLDEPTSALDPESKQSLLHLLLEIHVSGMTLAISSHDMPFIKKIADYVYYMEKGKPVEEWDKNECDISSKEKIQKFLLHI